MVQSLQLFKYMTQQQTITTAIRVRPPLPLQHRDDLECLTIDSHRLTVKTPSIRKQFDLPFVFGQHTSQQSIFEALLQPLADGLVRGYSCAFLSCGPQSSGKSYTLEGGDSQQTKGIVARLIDYLGNRISEDGERTYLLRASFVDVFEEEIIDLLGVRRGQAMSVVEKGRQVSWKGVALKHARNISDIEDFYELGNRKRRFAYKKKRRNNQQATSIFSIHLQSCETEGRQSLRKGKLHIVDMAAFPVNYQNIHYNLSTYALRNTAHAIVYGQGKTKVPYQDSKVTFLLREHLGGFGKATFLFHLSPALQQISMSLESLRLAKVLGQIENSPNCHPDPSEMMILTRLDELDDALAQLKQLDSDRKVQEQRKNILQKGEIQELEGQDNEFLAEQFVHQKKLEDLNKQIDKLEHERSALNKKIQNLQCLFLKIDIIPKINRNPNLYQSLGHSNPMKTQQSRFPRSPQSVGSQYGINRNQKQQIFELQKQFQSERQVLLARIRQLQGQFRFYQQVSKQTIKQEQLDILRHSSHYDETSRTYQIPQFTISHKKMSLAGKFSSSPNQSQVMRTMLISARSNGPSKSLSNSKSSWRGVKEIRTGIPQRKKDKKEVQVSGDEYGLSQVRENVNKGKLSQSKSASNLFKHLARMRFK